MRQHLTLKARANAIEQQKRKKRNNDALAPGLCRSFKGFTVAPMTRLNSTSNVGLESLGDILRKMGDLFFAPWPPTTVAERNRDPMQEQCSQTRDDSDTGGKD